VHIVQVLQEGVDAGVYLDTPVWNALLMCTGGWILGACVADCCCCV